MIRIIIFFCVLAINSSAPGLAQSSDTTTKDSVSKTDTAAANKGFIYWYGQSGITPAADHRSEDGVSLGLTFKSKGDELLRQPDRGIHTFTALHSLSTKSFILKYRSLWFKVFRNTD